MQDRPNAVELVGAVRHFLENEVLPANDDHRLRFRTLVAANALAILERELTAGAALAQKESERLQTLLGVTAPPDSPPEQQVHELRLALSQRIRAGDADHGPWRDAVMAATLASVRAKLSISNPKLAEQDERRNK